MDIYDISDYRQSKYHKMRILRKLLYIIFGLYIIVYFSVHYQDYSIQSLKRTLTYLSIAHTQDSIGENIFVEIDRYTDYGIFQNGVATLNRDILTYTNPASQTDIEIPYSYQNSSMRIGRDSVIIFDRQGYEFSVSNSFGVRFSAITSSPIIDISISDNDYYAIITDETAYISAVTVFNDKNSQIFKWSTSTYNVVCARIDDNAEKMVALCIQQENQKATAIVFDIKNSQISNQVEFSDKMPIDAKFLDNGNFAIIFSDNINILDKDLNVLFDDYTLNLQAYNIQNGHNILYAIDDDIGTEVILVNSNGKEQARVTLDFVIKSFLVSNDAVYILTSDYVYKFNHDLHQVEQIYTESSILSIIYNNYIYGVYNDRIARLF